MVVDNRQPNSENFWNMVDLVVPNLHKDPTIKMQALFVKKNYINDQWALKVFHLKHVTVMESLTAVTSWNIVIPIDRGCKKVKSKICHFEGLDWAKVDND